VVSSICKLYPCFFCIELSANLHVVASKYSVGSVLISDNKWGSFFSQILALCDSVFEHLHEDLVDKEMMMRSGE